MAEAIRRSGRKPRLYSYMKSNNPGIADLSDDVCLGSYSDLNAMGSFARKQSITFAVIGPEDPLNQGIVDALSGMGIAAVGPTKSLARLETSKSFTRRLLEKYAIRGNISFRVFQSLEGVEAFMDEIGPAVIKPDGLTGGKGVMVQGEHFDTPGQALAICGEILREHPSLTIEEKLEGEEFSLQCFCDGRHVMATPPVQDHKRRFVNDEGPNTGGMGSYSCEDHLLPFLTRKDIEDALAITREVAAALYRETGASYKGIMYGGFMITPKGVRLLEYNARLGDPEAMNVLPLLRTDFTDICQAVMDGSLDRLSVDFEHQASVCKYIVPKGYGLPKDHPDASSTSAKIDVGDTDKARLYYASVDRRPDGLYMSTSRAIAVVGIAPTLAAAEQIAERAVGAVRGPVSYRPDIGTAPLIGKRVRHMKVLRGE